MINNVVLTGRLTKDVDLRYSQQGTAFASGTLAVDRNYTNRDGERETDFIRLNASGKRAETFANNFHKGELMGVEGSIRTGSYQNQNDETVYTTDVNVRSFTFLTPKSQKPQGQNNGYQGHNGYNQGQNGGYAGQNNGYQGQTNGQYQSSRQGDFGNIPPAIGEQIDIDEDQLPF